MWSKEIKKKYRVAFTNHRGGAKHRGIEFEFTYDEWLEMWLESGHMQERGYKQGQYCMARNGDVGPYAPWNVRIILSSENSKETKLNPGGTKRRLFFIGNQHKKGKKEGAITRARKSVSHTGVRPTDETRLKLTDSNHKKWAPGGVLRTKYETTGNKKSEEAKAAMKQAALERWKRLASKEERSAIIAKGWVTRKKNELNA